MSDEMALDARAYRDVIGRFATGVTVVTMHDGEQPQGMTANAITSVSLDPMLVLVCVDKGASVYEPMQRAGAFAVNILTGRQRAVSEFFARTGRGEDGDPMGGFPYRSGPSGVPILDGTLGWLECRPWRQYEGGDHTIVVGEVVRMELAEPDGEPLLFYAGAFGQFTDAG